MKKIKILLALSAAATAFCALAFVNNLVAVAHWWSAFLAAGGDSASVAAKAPGCVPWLDWTAVDYSAVTTFIPLLGFTCMTVSLWRMLRGRRFRAGDFPFFRGSDQLNVALGLFGTLWGIIVIGYFRLDTVTMADLMQCLHTALFSTLMAVVWVFMFDRPLVRPYFTRLLERIGLAETDDGDLAAAVDRLVVRLGAASDAFEKRQREFEAAFEKRQREFEAVFEKRRAAQAEAFESRAAEFESAFERRAAEYESAFKVRSEAAEESFKKRADAFDGSFKKRADAFDAEFERRRGEYAAHFEKRLAEYERSFEERQREYREFFLREIEGLKAKAKASEEARTAAEARLARVDAAIRG